MFPLRGGPCEQLPPNRSQPTFLWHPGQMTSGCRIPWKGTDNLKFNKPKNSQMRCSREAMIARASHTPKRKESHLPSNLHLAKAGAWSFHSSQVTHLARDGSVSFRVASPMPRCGRPTHLHPTRAIRAIRTGNQKAVWK